MGSARRIASSIVAAFGEQHWIVSVQDSINDYREIQSGYFDGPVVAAEEHFRTNTPWMTYFGDFRYQITMQANPVILQWPRSEDVDEAATQ